MKKLIVVLAILFLVIPCQADIIAVDATAGGANDGSSWEDAFNSLPYALDVALSGDEIRVAQGIYRPNDGVITTVAERELTFQLKNGVVIKGGYAGFGEPDPNTRNIELYETILSGDLNSDDSQVSDPCDLLDDPNRAENSYNVVTGNGTDATAVVDGFTITQANNSVRGSLPPRGGGMCNRNGSPTILNCTFSDNTALAFGFGFGGAVYNSNSDAKFINCHFINNYANHGGGVQNHSWRSNLVPSFINCTFYGNASAHGGAVYNWDCDAVILNSILWNNEPDEMSGYQSRPVVTYSDIQGGWAGEGNMDVDPQFVNSTEGNYRLLSSSLCIDAGDPNYVASPNEIDLDGNPRIVNGIIDMGAYEFVPDPIELLLELIQDVSGLGIQKGIEKSLFAKLDTALEKLEDDNEKNDVAAINLLQAFINAVEAQSGKKISDADADALIEAAQKIIELLSD